MSERHRIVPLPADSDGSDAGRRPDSCGARVAWWLAQPELGVAATRRHRTGRHLRPRPDGLPVGRRRRRSSSSIRRCISVVFVCCALGGDWSFGPAPLSEEESRRLAQLES
jgi:hypothetical protein